MKKLYAMLALIISSFCSYAQTYLSVQDFSTASGTTPPAGWTNVSNNEYPGTVWKFVTTTPVGFFAPLTGANVAFPYATIGNQVGYGTRINTNLTSPSFSTTGSANATLEFGGCYLYNYSDTATIEYSLDGGTTWALVKNIQENFGEVYQGGLCSFVVIPLPAAAQNRSSVKLRFSLRQHNSGGNWYMAIDNVKVINRAPAVISAAAAGGYWGDTATWAGGRVPAYFDDVIIPDGALVLNEISPKIKNLTVGNGVSGYITFKGYPYQELTVTGNLVTNPGSTFDPTYNTAEGRHVTVKGNLTLNGTSDFSLENTRLRLTGTTPQTISGTGNLGGSISPVRNMEMANPAGITISRILTITERGDIDGNVNNGTNLFFDNTMGIGLDSVGLYVKGNSNFSNPVLVGANAKYCVNYDTDYGTTPVAKVTSNEIPANNTLYRLLMNNDAGVTVNKNLEITGPYALDLYLGTITIAPSNSITCTNSAFNGVQGEYRRGFVQGGDLILTCTGTSTKTFPVGSNGNGAYITFNNLQANGQVSMRLLNSGAGAPGTGLTALSASRRWYSRLVTGTYSGYSNVTIKINENDNFGSSPRANFRVGFQTSLVSNYNSVGQSNLAPNDYITSANAQTLFGYHALGLSSGNLPIVWTGSANTNNWGDAFNWRNNVLPTNADEVILDNNVTINLASGPGSYFAKTLTVRNGSTLNSNLPNTLTVGPAIGKNGFFGMYGNFNMSNGTISVNGKMQCGGGPYTTLNFQMSGGNIKIDGNDGGNAATSVSGDAAMLYLGITYNQEGSIINGTGGTITIVDPNATTASVMPVMTMYIISDHTGLVTLAGTTIKLGDGISTDACQEQGFTIESDYNGKNVPVGNVIVDSRTDGNGYRYLGTAFTYGNKADIGGNLTIMPNAEVRTSASTATSSNIPTIRVGGNLTNNGTIRIFGYNEGRLVMGSSPYGGSPETTAPQTISGSGKWSNSEYIVNHNMNSLVVNNRGGITLNMPLNVVHNLDLTKGAVTTTAANLITHGDFYYNTPGKLIVDSGYINGPLKRLIPANTFSDSTGLFPIGIGNVYRPAKINFTTAPLSAGSLTARFVATAGGMNGLPLNDAGTQINVVSQQGYWEITTADILDGMYNAEFTGTGFGGIINPAELRIIKRADAAAPWALQGTHTAGAGFTAKRNGLTGFSQFAIAANSLNNSLPVSLINFRGNKQESINKLSWTTITEINNAGFELQRSADGINFNKIDFINSAAINGNSNAPLNYQYSDSKGFAGNNYYRLRQIDKDAKAVLSNAILIKGSSSNSFEIKGIYPNPAVLYLQLAITGAENGKSTIEILDASGKLMQKQATTLITGNNAITINVSSLAKGTYLIKLINENGSSTKYFVKE